MKIVINRYRKIVFVLSEYVLFPFHDVWLICNCDLSSYLGCNIINVFLAAQDGFFGMRIWVVSFS